MPADVPLRTAQRVGTVVPERLAKAAGCAHRQADVRAGCAHFAGARTCAHHGAHSRADGAEAVEHLLREDRNERADDTRECSYTNMIGLTGHRSLW